jgi:hypothetical protein
MEVDAQHMKLDCWVWGRGFFFPFSFVCMFACVGTCVYMHMLMLEVDVRNCLYHSPFQLIHWGRSLSPFQNSLRELVFLPSLLWGFLSTSSEDGVTGKLPQPPVIYTGSRNPHLCPQAYAESAVTLSHLCSTLLSLLDIEIGLDNWWNWDSTWILWFKALFLTAVQCKLGWAGVRMKVPHK